MAEEDKAGEEQQTGDAQVEERVFQTEVQQLLHLLIHSLYTQKEIFQKGDRGYHLDINSGTVEMKNNKVTALVE
mgnify:CR=1 FL=1